ncbi:MAG: metallophosphoesterase [Clostridia bacterium]|nr:metallophosphoesterase [Clostridia bacterium]
MSRTKLARFLWLTAFVGFCALIVVCRPLDGAVSASPSPTVPALETAFAPASESVAGDSVSIVISAEATLVPTARPTPTPEPTPTPIPQPFCIAWISDTQYYSYSKPAVFLSMTEWLVANKDGYDIRFVVHTGDIVDNHTYDRHWENAKAAIDVLAGELPLYCVAGNHDVGTGAADYSRYSQYDFCDQRDEAMQYEGGECWYHTFTEGGTDFLLLGIGWQADDDCIPWCEEVISSHPDHVGIIIVHSFLSSGGKLSTNGELIEQRLIAPYPSVRLLLCGHNDGSVRLRFEYEEGARTVNAMMYNFQDDKQNGLGYLRLLVFDPLTRNISVTTYSPYLDDYDYYQDESRDTFVLTDAF